MLPCPACGYDLSGVPGPLCPECGGDVAALRAAFAESAGWLARPVSVLLGVVAMAGFAVTPAISGRCGCCVGEDFAGLIYADLWLQLLTDLAMPQWPEATALGRVGAGFLGAPLAIAALAAVGFTRRRRGRRFWLAIEAATLAACWIGEMRFDGWDLSDERVILSLPFAAALGAVVVHVRR